MIYKVDFTDTAKGVYCSHTWARVDVEINSAAGDTIFFQGDVEIPASWSDRASRIVASKYFRGTIGETNRETSVFQLVSRVVTQICNWGGLGGYFTSADDAKAFWVSLANMALRQEFFWNSPVWFNLGAEGRKQQASACFINSVEDNMESILRLGMTEGLLFKGGSGTGTNMSKLRAEGEPLSTGGTSTGPLSFMKALDANAGAIKSGGATRRAARMMVMDDWHPDVVKFIECKVDEDTKAKALIKYGLSAGLNGEAYSSVAHQNANHSVRLSDRFMHAVGEDADWDLTYVTTGEVSTTLRARDLLQKIASATWTCGDPGVQFSDTINSWHTCPQEGPINASNPCSEYLFLDDTACNLGSINLVKFYDVDTGAFDLDRFCTTIQTAIKSMDIIVEFADYPTGTIQKNSVRYRTLGLGYSNLGALLMLKGLPYGSREGRNFAAAITAYMTAVAYETSVELSEDLGNATGIDAKNILSIVDRHAKAAEALGSNTGGFEWESSAAGIATAAAGILNRVASGARAPRNAQVTVLAPTGTISFAMDCDTTGIEPELGLVKFKTLVGGGVLGMPNRLITHVLRGLGSLDETTIAQAIEHLNEQGTLQNCELLSIDERKVFLCSLKSSETDRCLTWKNHVDMMAACQPFLSGAISKTINMPESATVQEIEDAYLYAWKSGLKCVAIYRDGCKSAQPVRAGKIYDETSSHGGNSASPEEATRRRLPQTRLAVTHKFSVGGCEGYITPGFYEDGQIGELFLNVSKEGSTISGLFDAVAVLISIGLQHGVPVGAIVNKLRGTKFDPAGITCDKNIPIATSIPDYVAQYLQNLYQVTGQGSAGVVAAAVTSSSTSERPNSKVGINYDDNTFCALCGNVAVRSGTCYVCTDCGTTTGCG